MKKKKLSVIYKIINLVNEKIYIGSAVNYQQGKTTHISRLRRNKHTNKHLQRSWNKHGKNNFIFEIIEKVELVKNLIEREQYYLDTILFAQEHIKENDKRFLEIGYNLNPTARNRFGTKLSIASRKKLSEAHKGVKFSIRTRKKMSIAHSGKNNSFYGKNHTEETKEKISNSNKGRKMSAEVKNILSEKNKVGIIQYKNGKIIKRWDSMKSAEEELGIKYQHISAVCRGKRKKAGGFYWKYEKS